MSQHFGMWSRDCQEDEETDDLIETTLRAADAAIGDDGVIDAAEYRRIVRPMLTEAKERTARRVSRSADQMDLVTCLTAELKNGDDAPRVIRLRGERRQRKGAPLNWRVIEGGKQTGEDEPDWAA